MLKQILDGLKSLVKSSDCGCTGERRRVVRLKCRYEVTCLREHVAFRAVLVDMGVRGLRLETHERLKPGQAIHVSFNAPHNSVSVESVKCKVCWARRNKQAKLEAGLCYDEPQENLERSWVKVILREVGFDAASIVQRRKARRVVAMLRGEALPEGHRPMACRVLNLGAGGALLQLPEALEKGQALAMLIGPGLGEPPLKVAGEVVSCRYESQSSAWFCGTRFADLSDRQLDQLSRYIVLLLKDAAT